MIFSFTSVREKRKISPCGLTKAALNLLRKGVQKAVIIHYPEGAFALCKNGDKIEVPSIHLDLDNIKGTVGAGDALCSGILYSIHEGFDIFKSIEIANRAAWYNIQSETSTGGAVSIKKILNDIG